MKLVENKKDCGCNKSINEDWSEKYKRSIDCNNPKGFSQKAHCQGRKKSEVIGEALQLFLEKNCPTDSSKWSYYKSQAKSKFDVYPSAYANGWAAKQYKEAGGGWKKCDENTIKENNTSDIIKDLDKVKNDLLKKVDVLVAKKKKLYSNIDIESPMSADEKKLDKEIADLFSQINQLVLQKRNLKEEEICEACWDGYKQIGMKTKNGKQVPNCVPENTIKEGRGIKTIQNDLAKVLEAIQKELEKYKSSKGTPQEKIHINNLKTLNSQKSKLTSELDNVVSGLYKDAELKGEDASII